MTRKQNNISINFEPEGRVASKVTKGELLLNVAMDVGAGLRSECGGKGTCKKCLVHPVDLNFLSPPEEREKGLLGNKIKQGLRLACQSSVLKSGTVLILKESRTKAGQLQMTGKEQIIDIEPLYIKIPVKIPVPSLEDQRSDLTRIIKGVQDVLEMKSIKIIPELLARVNPEILRKENWDLLVTLKDSEIVEITPGSGSNEILGVAIDIGTSKIVGHLVNLKTGETLAVAAIENPQLPYGEDIISRISFTKVKPENLAILKEKVVTSINEQIIDELVKQLGTDRNNIYSLIAVGNTTMQHLFLGVNPEFLGRAPYVPVFTESINVKASATGVIMNPTGTVTLFPAIGGVIGGDCVAVALATGMDVSEDLSMAVDVGTNTEIILGNSESLTATSCASGPAFEGYHVHDGMKAVEGAIEHLKIDPETFDVDFQVIGDVKPSGICGSAIIDCLAELIRVRLVDNRGRLHQDPENKRLTGEKRHKAFVIATPGETATGKSIMFTQEDVRNIQLAKAAILTGAYLLMKDTRTIEKDIKHVYLAGAFGNHVNPVNAKVIGMLPDFSRDTLEFVGNAAVSGAKQALISKKELKRAKNIAGRTRFLELAIEKQFQQEYASAMYLPHQDLSKFPSLLSIQFDFSQSK
ncbi:MAG: ASKHA domain-containing protein [Candidatus Hodarchaeales archaeon]